MEAITIAIPFYRGEGFLRDAMDSVLAQTSSDWQLLVVDDSASARPEAVSELVSSYADARIRSLRNSENLGMVDTWNRCIAETRTDLVTLLHGDDRLLPGYVALMQRLGERHARAAALYCRAKIIDESGRETFSLPDAIKRFFAPGGDSDETRLLGEPAATALMSGNFIMCPTLCFRRSVLRGRHFEPRWSQVQDLELTVRLLMEGDELVGAREIAYAYRRHPESATSLQSENRLRFDEEFRLFEEVASRAEELGWTRAGRVARRKRIVKLHLLYRTARELLALHPGRAFATLRYLASRW